MSSKPDESTAGRTAVIGAGVMGETLLSGLVRAGRPVGELLVGEGGAEKDAGAMLGQQGTHYLVGYGGTIELPTGDLVGGEKQIAGCQVGTYLDLVDLVQLTVDGHVALHNRTYPLAGYEEAFADMKAGRLVGRAVLVP